MDKIIKGLLIGLQVGMMRRLGNKKSDLRGHFGCFCYHLDLQGFENLGGLKQKRK